MDEELKTKLKAAGLDFAEETVKDLVENAFKTLNVIIDVTENKYDDMAKPLIDLAQKALMPLIDKIDGQQD